MAKIRSLKVRKQVLEHYNFCCAACGCADRRALQIDHVHSQTMGGTDEFENLQALCGVCNNIKGNVITPRLEPRKPVGYSRKWEKPRQIWQAAINGWRAEQRA
jgi:5-methylcytosine-specific restriction endonuclease McrA